MVAGVRAILVLRGGALGDFIVTLPTLLALRERFPASRMVLVGNRVAAEIARTRGLIDEVQSQHDRRWAPLCVPEPLPAELREWLSGFDLVVNFWPDDDGAIASHFPVRPGQTFLSAGGPPAVHAGFGTAGGPPALPAAAYLARALEPRGIQPRAWYCELGETRIHWPEPARTEACRHADGLAVHPGSGSPRKNWPRRHWLELLTQRSTTVLLIVGEVEAREWSATALRETPLAAKLADGTLRVLESAPLERLVRELRSCRAYVGHDTGISHLAAACGLPSLLLFGPTDPAIWAPPAPHVRVLHQGPSLENLEIAVVARALCDLLRNAKAG